MNADFEQVLTELRPTASCVGGEALGDPAAPGCTGGATASRWPADGPYSEAKEHLAGFFLIDVESQERAEEIAAQFSGPGETVELRPRCARWRRPVTRSDPRADVWRREAPHVLGGAAAPATAISATARTPLQDAAEAAAAQWPVDGMPDDPRAWLIRVASRRLIDRVRADRPGSAARRRGRTRPADARRARGPTTWPRHDRRRHAAAAASLLPSCADADRRRSRLTLRAVAGFDGGADRGRVPGARSAP